MILNLEAAHEFLITRRLVVLRNGEIVLPSSLQVESPIEARPDGQHGKGRDKGTSESRARDSDLPRRSTSDPIDGRNPKRVERAVDYSEVLFHPGRIRPANGRRPIHSGSAAWLAEYCPC